MRYLLGFLCVCALGLVPLVGCSEGGSGGTGGAGGNVTETIEQMLVGRWWLDWDQAEVGNPTPGAIGLLTFTTDGWANYDVKFASIPCYTDWFRLYTNWSLFDVVSETEFGYALTYTQGSCNREVGWTEEFKVVLDQLNPPKGKVTRLLFPEEPGLEWTMPIERCTTDINATEACTFDTGLGAPTQNPPTVELTLTLVVGAPSVAARPPLEGAAFCETNTENCAMTDANGQATIEVVVPADQQISYTYTKEGYLSVLYSDVVDETLFTDRSHWTLTDAEMERLTDLLMTPYPYEETGALIVSVGLIGATFELVGASGGKGFYADAQGEPSLDLDSTTIYGEGGFVEVAPDEVEVRLGGTATNCTPLSAWPGSEANTIRMPIKVGFLSWSSMSCGAP